MVKVARNHQLGKVLGSLKNPPLRIPLNHQNEVADLSSSELDELWKTLELNSYVILHHTCDGDDRNTEAESNVPNREIEDGDCDGSEVQEKKQEFLWCVLKLAYCTADREDLFIPAPLPGLVTIGFNAVSQNNIRTDIKNQAVNLCALWLKKDLVIQNAELIKVFHYALRKALQKNASKTDVRSVWPFRQAVGEMMEKSNVSSVIKDDLLKAAVTSNFLKYKEGRNFIGFMMALNKQITLDFHYAIKDYLPVSKEGEAYGNVYYYAWNYSSDSLKKVIENDCIQFYMMKVFVLKRQAFSMILVGQNTLRILNRFHEQRQFAHVRKMLSTLYEPLLWRHLSSPNNIHRCNAAEVLFDAYPLERPGQGRQLNDLYLHQQHDAIYKLLTDKCHIVRIIAARQACRLLSSYWNAIPPETIQRWMKSIGDLSKDFSSMYVRRSVYRGLQSLLDNPLAVMYLQEILPRFRKNFHDPSEQVRVAYVDMLLAIKTSKQKLKYWNVIPLEELVARLEVENEMVGSRLVDLLFDSFFAPHFDQPTIISRLVQLIALNRRASLKFFYFSKKRLPLDQAVEMILIIISVVHAYVKKKVDACKSDDEPVRKKKRLFSGKENTDADDSSISGSSESAANTTVTSTTTAMKEKDEGKERPLDKPEINRGFLEIAGVIWHIHLTELAKSENSELRSKIHGVNESALPLFLRYYKNDTILYSTVLGLCSFMPVSKLKRVCTVESTCMSQLKQLELNCPKSKILMYIVPLCMWDRGADVLYLVKHWIKEAFKKAAIESIPRSSSRREKRVKFIEEKPKPKLGLRFLDAIFSVSRCKVRVLSAHTSDLFGLWLCMGSIKELIDERLKRGEQFNDPELSDCFLLECFDRYLTMLIHLDEVDYEETFRAILEFSLIIDWSLQTVLPHVPSELNVSSFVIEEDSIPSVPLAVSALKVIIKCGTCLILLGKADVRFCGRLGVLVKNCLEADYKIMFVNTACEFVNTVLDFIKTYYKMDEAHLFKLAILYLVKMCLQAVSEHHLDQVSVKYFIDDFSKVKTTLSEVLLFCERIYGKSKLLPNVVQIFVDTSIKVVRTAYEKEEFQEPVTKLSGLPFVASQLVSIFQPKISLSKHFCSQLGSYFKDHSHEVADTTYTLAALHVFYTLAYSPGKIPTDMLILVFDKAKECFKTAIIKGKSCKSTTEETPGVTLEAEGGKILNSLEEKLLGCTKDPPAIIQNLQEDMERCTLYGPASDD